MTLELEYNGSAQVPLEVEGIVPEAIRDSSVDEIQRLETFHGNRPTELGEFFRVLGDPSDLRMRWFGDLTGVHWVGAKMGGGEIIVEGNVGRHVGSEMRGGSIDVQGNSGDWVGGEMKGGLIHVRGDAGHLVGAAYRGSARGMVGGTILIDGSAGNEVGHSQRRGLIAIGERVGDLAGFNMLAGTILLFGECGIRHAAGMRRGSIAFFGARPELLPTFRFACRLAPDVLKVVLRQLRRWGFSVDDELMTAEVDLYNGDMIEGGRGEVLVRAEA
jgi:formylmethanofuran dehydrogenase subunit C